MLGLAVRAAVLLFSNKNMFHLPFTMTQHEGYLLSLAVSSSILLILWILIIRQLCVSPILGSRIGNYRLRRVSLLTVFSTLSLLHNALIYLTNIYPNYSILRLLPLWLLAYTIEAISFMLGIYLYGLCELSIINGIYIPNDIDPPRWFRVAVYVIRNKKWLYFAVAAVFYGFAYSNRNTVTLWTQRFYTFLTSIICVESLAIVFVLNRVLRILNTVPIDVHEVKLQKAKRGIRMSMAVFSLLCIVSILAVGISTQILYGYLPIELSSYIISFQMCIMHSVFLILINTSLWLWIYKRRRCCTLQRGTVCDFCGFVDIMEWIVGVVYACCVRRPRDDDERLSLLLEHSVQSRDTDRITNDGRDSKITTLNSQNITVMSSTKTTI